MKVTEIKVFPVREEKLKAFVSIVIDRCFMVNDIKVIQGKEDLFISMPSRRKKNGKFKDVAHPLNNETRQMIEGLVLEEYRLAIGERDADESPVVAPEEAAPASEEAAPPVPAAVDSSPAPPVETTDEPPAEPPAVEERAELQAPEERVEEPQPAAEAEPAEGSDDEDKSLEEVTELHLRDSFWST